MTQSTPTSSRPKADLEAWWLHPAWIVSAMGLIVVPASYLIPDWMYREYWRMPKLIDLRVMDICLYCIAAFSVGAFAGSTRSHAASDESRYAWTRNLPWPFLHKAFAVSFYLTLLGYVVWGAAAVSRGLSLQLVLRVLKGEKGLSDEIKNVYLVTISGVTTLTQFGHVVVVLGGIIGTIYGWKYVRTKVGLMFLLALVRALLNSERLAIIELAIPLAVVVIRLAVLDSPRMVGTIRILVLAAPLYAGVLLLCLFGASEYFRSWNYYAGGKLTFPQFVSLRLLGYYVTAINNGAILLERVQPTGAPFFTGHFLWRFPLLSDIVKSLYPDLPFGGDDDSYMTVIGVDGNPEFNNGDGYLLPILDYGLFGALLYWVVMGLLVGWLYRLFCRKHILGLTIYPVAFIGVVEMPRVMYWGEGRVFPAFVALGIVSYLCVRSRAWSIELERNHERVLGRSLSPENLS